MIAVFNALNLIKKHQLKLVFFKVFVVLIVIESNLFYNITNVVGMTGFEPATPSTPC